MDTSLTPQEKLNIIDQHVQNILFTQYNLNLSLIEANASASTDANVVSSLNTQMSQANAQIAALQAEYDSVASQITVTSSN
jgi:hypothetical protein